MNEAEKIEEPGEFTIKVHGITFREFGEFW